VRFVATLGDDTRVVEVIEAAGGLRVTIGEEVWEVDARLPAPGTCSLLVGGISYVADVKEEAGCFLVDVEGESYRIRLEEEARHLVRTRGGREAGRGGQVLVAPMPGKIVSVEVQAGQAVTAGDGLLVMEAMKMENEFRAAAAGTVKEVRVQVGQAVNAGDVLVVIE
jgi:biotin carboxyl carrier protein